MGVSHVSPHFRTDEKGVGHHATATSVLHIPLCLTPTFAHLALQAFEYVVPSPPQTGSYFLLHTQGVGSVVGGGVDGTHVPQQAPGAGSFHSPKHSSRGGQSMTIPSHSPFSQYFDCKDCLCLLDRHYTRGRGLVDLSSYCLRKEVLDSSCAPHH